MRSASCKLACLQAYMHGLAEMHHHCKVASGVLSSRYVAYVLGHINQNLCVLPTEGHKLCSQKITGAVTSIYTSIRQPAKCLCQQGDWPGLRKKTLNSLCTRLGEVVMSLCCCWSSLVSCKYDHRSSELARISLHHTTEWSTGAAAVDRRKLVLPA